jgi:hypothetical protein
MSWHAETAVLQAYAEGELDEVRALSVEAHLLACEPCRLQLVDLADRPRLEAVWDQVAVSIEAPSRTVAERLLVRFGVPEHRARLVAATPSLSGAWLVGVAFSLVFAVVAAHVGSSGSLVFLALAPLLPVAGVAVAYGPWLDPLYEVSLAAPMSNFTLLLLRTSAILASTLALAGAAALALPGPWWVTAAWLLPTLALTVLALALGSYLPQAMAACAVGLGWITVVVLVSLAAEENLAAFRLGGQAACVAAGLLAAGVLVRRRFVFDQGELDV